jgi:hypothetical protein
MRYQRKSRRPGQPAAPSESTRTAEFCRFNAVPRQLRRRRVASWRLPPLDCGCRDPWTCKHYRDAYISDKQADAAVAAIEHLDLVGTPGLLDVDTCRAMWRIGFRDLAVEVDARTRGSAA